MLAAGLFAASMCGRAALALEIADIAMVTEIKGNVETKAGRLKKMDGLSKPCTIALDSDAKAVLFYFDGVREYTLSGPGTFEFSATGLTMSSASGAISIKWQDPYFNKLPRTGMRVAQAGTVLRTAAQVDPGYSPPDDENVPVFSLNFFWKLRPHLGAWQFRLADAAGNMLYETETATYSARLPTNLRLAPGSRYHWDVSWLDRDGNRQSEPHFFTTFDTETESRAAQLKPDRDGPEAARTLYGLWLDSVGAHSLARQYISHRYNPDTIPR